MQTSKKQTSHPGVEKLMSLPAGSPASRSVSPASEREQQTTAISGRKCFAQYERSGPLGLLVKTLLESSQWYNPAVRLQWKVKPLYLKRLTKKRYSNRNTLSKPSAEILNKKDITSSRLLFRLVPSVRHTGEIGFGLLPTVQTQGLKICNEKGKTEFINLKLLPTPTAMMPSDQDMKKLDAGRQAVRRRKGNGNGFGVTLNEMAKKGLLPTPNARDSDKYSKKYKPNSQSGSALPANGMLPTPTANCWKTPCDHGTGSPNLQTHIARICGETSQLNPLFVAEMMGFPSMWCVLPFLSGGGAQGQLKDTETP